MGILSDKGEILDMEPFPAIVLFSPSVKVTDFKYMSPGYISS